MIFLLYITPHRVILKTPYIVLRANSPSPLFRCLCCLTHFLKDQPHIPVRKTPESAQMAGNSTYLFTAHSTADRLVVPNSIPSHSPVIRSNKRPSQVTRGDHTTHHDDRSSGVTTSKTMSCHSGPPSVSPEHRSGYLASVSRDSNIVNQSRPWPRSPLSPTQSRYDTLDAEAYGAGPAANKPGPKQT